MEDKKCLFCGKVFKPNSPRQNVCKDNHYSNCPICGKPVLIKESYQNYIKNLEKNGPRVCQSCRGKKIAITRNQKSDEEKKQMIEKQKATMMTRYGSDNAMKISKFKEKALNTVKTRYGVDCNVSQSVEIQERIRKNSLQKYGVDHPAKALVNREHMKLGMLEKYGDTCPQRVPEIRQRTISTTQLKYGVDNVFQVEEFKEKQRESTKSHYGVEYSMQNEEIKERARQTNIQKYGAVSYVQSDEYLSTLITDSSKIHEYRKFCTDEREYILKNWSDPNNKPSLQVIASAVGISCDSVGERAIRHNFTDLIEYNRSRMEEEIVECIRKICPDEEIIRNTKSIINPFEIDIYLPSRKLGIECNPTCTHNSSIKDPWGGPPKSPSYHRRKSEIAEIQHINLVHIFGYEWAYKRDIIASMLADKLGKIDNKIFARKCKIDSDISSGDCRKFLYQNHRQGPAYSQIRLGLRTADTSLVSIMTFSKMRHTIGYTEHDNSNTFELVRFCNLLNSSVVGGASKLFKHFIKTYKPDKVVSFSDKAHTSGKLYEVLGFEKVSVSDAGYVWVNLKDDSYLTRVKCQKRNLPVVFHDVTEEDIQNKTEKQIMMEHGYVQVFDSGVIRWEWANKNK